MKKLLILALCLSILPAAATLSAKTVKIPADEPSVSIDVPDSWKPEETEHGTATESADGEATVFFEVTDAKGMDSLLDENIEWLKEQKVTINEDTKSEKDFKSKSMSWSRIAWEGTSKEWGPAVIGFAFSDIGNGKLVVVTYWITKKGFEKHEADIDKIFDSVKKTK